MKLAAHSTASPTPTAMRQSFIMTCRTCVKKNPQKHSSRFFGATGLVVVDLLKVYLQLLVSVDALKPMKMPFAAINLLVKFNFGVINKGLSLRRIPY
jgi:hypothetical protein